MDPRWIHLDFIWIPSGSHMDPYNSQMDPFGSQIDPMYSRGCRYAAGVADVVTAGAAHVQQGLHMYSRGCRCTAGAADMQQGLQML